MLRIQLSALKRLAEPSTARLRIADMRTIIDDDPSL
jgi:hypothetical protein